MSAAQLAAEPSETLSEPLHARLLDEGPASQPASARQLAAERLQAHRQRRARQTAAANAVLLTQEPGARNKVADAVAARYASTPSFRARLAEEAQRSMESAAAAAEVALRNAEAVQQAQVALLAELARYVAPVEFSAATAEVVTAAEGPELVAGPTHRDTAGAQIPAPPAAVKEVSAAGLTVKLYEDVGPLRPAPLSRRQVEMLSEAEARALEEEIAFRKAPVFEPVLPVEPAVPLPANLLEFPRQLVAPRKARPQLAEGPLLAEEQARAPQMRIFEVGPELAQPDPEPASPGPWNDLWLDAHTVTEPEAREDEHTAVLASLLPPQVAPLHLRLMAAGLDATLVLAGFVTFCAAAAHMSGPVALTLPLAAGAALVLVAFYVIYQALFFTLSDQTPGMRYARIGLCTFSDENPSRGAMRKRELAKIVSVLPLCLGLIWALMDDDRLCWHDRMSRMYQRSY